MTTGQRNQQWINMIDQCEKNRAIAHRVNRFNGNWHIAQSSLEQEVHNILWRLSH